MCAASRVLPKRLFLAVVLLGIFPFSTARATTRYISIAKCSELQFAVPQSPALNGCPICNVDERGVLNCECFVNGVSGPLKATSLAIYSCPRNYAFPRCADYIEVNNGELSCRKISEDSTYHKQCWSCSTEGSKLTCECWKENREHLTSVLDMKNCDAPISNCFGVLTCGQCPPRLEPEANFMRPVLITVAGSIGFVVAARLFWTQCVRR